MATRQIMILIAAVFFLAAAHNASAMTIELDDGNTVVGDIVHESDSEIIVSRDGGKVIENVPRERVKGIRESTASETGSQDSLLSRAKGALSGAQNAFNRWKDNRKTEEADSARDEKYQKEVEAAKKSREREKIKKAKAEEAKKAAAKAEAAKTKRKKGVSKQKIVGRKSCGS